MTIGTATVASTKVLSTLGRSARVSPSARLSAVSVGKTATQIISAIWCLVGGGAVGAVRISVMGVEQAASVLLQVKQEQRERQGKPMSEKEVQALKAPILAKYD